MAILGSIWSGIWRGVGGGSRSCFPALFPQKSCIQLFFHSFPKFLFCLTKKRLEGALNFNKAYSTVWCGFMDSQHTDKKSLIQCLNFNESHFPGSCKTLSPVKMSCIFPNPVLYFGQILINSGSPKYPSILGDPGADSGGKGKSKRAENMARRKVKNGEKSPWGQCLTRPVPNGRCHSDF